jgi:phage tail protein X
LYNGFDYTNHISINNNQISTINQSIANLQTFIGDGININFTDINKSIRRLQDQIDSMNSPILITTRVSTLKPNFKDFKVFVWN